MNYIIIVCKTVTFLIPCCLVEAEALVFYPTMWQYTMCKQILEMDDFVTHTVICHLKFSFMIGCVWFKVANNHNPNFGKMMKEMTEIFATIEESETSQFILVKGAAGIGKTVLLPEVAYRWGKQLFLFSTKA